MLHIHITAEDTTIVLKRTMNSAFIDPDKLDEPRKADTWKGFICDGPSGLEQEVEFTDIELASLQALLIDSDETPHADYHYKTLEDAVARYNWDNEAGKAFRPIP